MAGLVLAGGRGRRMGCDKAGIDIAGRSLLERVATTLDGLCGPVWVASGDGSRLEACPWPQLPDMEPDGGPLAGILAGLRAATAPLVAVVAVDMPFASGSVLELLARRWAGEPAVVPRVDGRLEPLHAVYATAALPCFLSLYASGERSVTGAVQRAGALVVDPGLWRVSDPTGRFATNLNRPADLPRILEEARSCPDG